VINKEAFFYYVLGFFQLVVPVSGLRFFVYPLTVNFQAFFSLFQYTNTYRYLLVSALSKLSNKAWLILKEETLVSISALAKGDAKAVSAKWGSVGQFQARCGYCNGSTR
jgi:hypothetical protein